MFKRILVPVDGTAGSESAVPYALDLAESLDADVVVCYVITTPITPQSAGEERDAARYVMGRIAEKFRQAGVVARTQVRRGEPAAEIKKAAVEWDVDAIVMATRSRRRLEKLVLGSVADAIVRDSRLPVLLVSSRKRLKRAASKPQTLALPTRNQEEGIRSVMRRVAGDRFATF